MFQVLNHTPFQVRVHPLIDKDGRDLAVCSVKGTFTFSQNNGEPRIAEKQLPVLLSETYFDSPENSEIKYPSDVVPGKPNTDIGLIGTVYSPMKEKVRKLTASLQVGPYRKTILAYGDRFWTKSLITPGYSMTDPEPFIRLPIRCHRMYGGKDRDRKGDEKVYDVNPHGTGFFLSKHTVGGSRLPNFELPDNRITNWRKQPQPASFGFANPSSPHRIKYAGTYDENWKENHFPLPPRDMDSLFFNCAQKELIANGYLKGGETVVMKNLTPSGQASFNLPRYSLTIKFHLLHETLTRTAPCQTLVIEPDEQTFYMVWSSRVALGKQLSNLRYAEAAMTREGSRAA